MPCMLSTKLYSPTLLHTIPMLGSWSSAMRAHTIRCTLWNVTTLPRQPNTRTKVLFLFRKLSSQAAFELGALAPEPVSVPMRYHDWIANLYMHIPFFLGEEVIK